MSHDLVIRGGTMADGSGHDSYVADVGISGDRITAIGKITKNGAREIDAEGHVVSPGFIDAHTHFDAQVNWDPLGTNSCWHGVTSVVMGNCGFTLAPCKKDERELVVRNLERAEAISAAAMAIGIRLPGGARRMIQKSDGFKATIVAGQVVLDDGEHTGTLPGKLLRQN